MWASSFRAVPHRQQTLSLRQRRPPIWRTGARSWASSHGYSSLQHYDAQSAPLVEGEHYRVFNEKDLRGLRNQRGVIIGTARANPGKGIRCREELADERKTERLRRVYNALHDLKIDALISIGGDDTLKTANFFYEFQKHLPKGMPRIRVTHVPKTIDNDYHGIDFTFGFFTAVDFMAKELMNLRADALATSGYYIVEAMGREGGLALLRDRYCRGG